MENQVNEEVVEVVEGAAGAAGVESKTFTQVEVDKMVQAEADKRVNQAISKKDADFQKQLEAEKERIKKEVGMSEEEKFQAQLQAEREAFESERTEFNKSKLKAFTLENLAKEGLATTFSAFLISDEEEHVTENIKLFKVAWEKELEKAVTERLKGKPIKQAATTLDGSDELTKEAFFKLPYKERTAMLAEDADLLQKLK